MKMKKIRTLAVVSGLAILIWGCSSTVQKADIPSDANPQDEISRLEADQERGKLNHYEVLAKDEFKKSIKYLKEAKEDYADNDSRADVLDELRYGRGYFNRAEQISIQRGPRVAGILSARSAAIQADSSRYPELKKKWDKADENFISELEEDSVSPTEFSEIQKDYQNIQFLALERAHLGDAKSKIAAAKDNGAKRKTPETLMQAETDYEAASNSISTNLNNPDTFAESCSRANRSAQFLTEVLAQANTGISETAAIKIVQQNTRIEGLNAKLSSADQQNSKMSEQMKSQQSDLSSAEARIEIQRKINLARQQFSAKDAEVYQQGDKVIVRLKGMNFASGKSEVPKRSEKLLQKVKEVAESLNARSIAVEGHTDSIGSKQKNQQLSEARAEAVATFMKDDGVSAESIETEGYGFSKPIASNKTSAGRAQNRRIDVVLSPGPNHTQAQEDENADK